MASHPTCSVSTPSRTIETFTKPNPPTDKSTCQRNAPSNATPQPFRFLDLPAQIRNHIYRLLLHKETRKRLSMAKLTSGIDLDPYEDWLRWQHNSLEPAILATSRAVHHEAAAIMYGTQPFSVRITGASLGTVWAVGSQGTFIPPRYMRLIRRFKVQVDLEYCCRQFCFREAVYVVCSNIKTFCDLVKHNAPVWALRKLKVQEEGQEVLEPFMLLRNVGDAVVNGEVEPLYALKPKAVMESPQRTITRAEIHCRSNK